MIRWVELLLRVARGFSAGESRDAAARLAEELAALRTGRD